MLSTRSVSKNGDVKDPSIVVKRKESTSIEIKRGGGRDLLGWDVLNSSLRAH